MEQVIYATGRDARNEDGRRIDQVIEALTLATSPREEKSLLMDLYCVLLAHIHTKHNAPERDPSPAEETRDRALLHDLRVKIWERDNAHITQLQLIRDLRQILKNHTAFSRYACQ